MIAAIGEPGSQRLRDSVRVVGGIQQHDPDVCAGNAQELLRNGQRHAQRRIVERLARRVEQSAHVQFDGIDAARSGVGEQHDLVADVDAEAGGESLAQQRPGRVVGGQAVALGEKQVAAQLPLLLRRASPPASWPKRRTRVSAPAAGRRRGPPRRLRNSPAVRSGYDRGARRSSSRAWPSAPTG